MNQTILKTCCFIIAIFCGLIASAQTIDYSYAQLGSSCNVFAHPTTQSGYVHQTTLGFPFFSSAKGAINLKTRLYKTDSIKSTQYAIAYPFIKGYKYSISVYGAAAGTPFTPNIGLALTTSLPPVDTSKSCSAGAQPFSVSSLSSFNQAAFSTSFAWLSNLVNGYIANQDYSDLIVAAFPNANKTDTLTDTVFVQKIQIIATAPFSLSPDTVKIPCGDTTSKVFTVNNVNSLSGTASYQWNIGATPNGWIYNGSPAPATITTSTNTLMLSPAQCSTTPSNIYATVTWSGTNYNTNSSITAITAPVMSISGSDAVCTSAIYTVTNLPCTATVTWSASNSNIALSSIGNQVTATMASNGVVTLTATVTNGCGIASNIIITKNLNAGVPYGGYGYYNYGGVQYPLIEATQGINNVCLTQPATSVATDLTVFNASNMDWSGLVSHGLLWTNGGTNISMIFRTVNQTGDFFLTATNGCGSMNNEFAFKSVTCAQLFSVSPNPASSEVTVTDLTATTENISVDKQSVPASKSISTNIIIRIYDAAGAIKKTYKFNKNGTYKLAVNDLTPGVYFLNINDGGNISTQKIIVQK